MPNWCTIEIDITGSEEDIKALHTFLGDRMDFNRIIPMPKELRGNHCLTQEVLDRLMSEDGANNWYDWAVKHWGTKWNTDQKESQSDWENTSVHFVFYTAWNPPEKIYHALVEKFPDLEIDWRYEEEGMGFRGNLATGEYQERI